MMAFEIIATITPKEKSILISICLIPKYTRRILEEFFHFYGAAKPLSFPGRRCGIRTHDPL